jgi:hypothetical protein
MAAPRKDILSDGQSIKIGGGFQDLASGGRHPDRIDDNGTPVYI